MSTGAGEIAGLAEDSGQGNGIAEMAKWNHNSREELEAAGYRYEGAGICKGESCGRLIEWWRTPKGKTIPLDPDTLEPHWSTCVNAKEFRKSA